MDQMIVRLGSARRLEDTGLKREFERIYRAAWCEVPWRGRCACYLRDP